MASPLTINILQAKDLTGADLLEASLKSPRIHQHWLPDAETEEVIDVWAAAFKDGKYAHSPSVLSPCLPP